MKRLLRLLNIALSDPQIKVIFHGTNRGRRTSKGVYADGPVKFDAEVEMSFLKKLLGQKNDYEPGKRVRVCVECGMPVADHKDWCAIYRETQRREEVEKTA